jgi:glycine/D-amino acid oxidase-like deaminating enzyme
MKLSTDATFDAVVVGGGFYGTAIALYLSERRFLKRVLLVETENAILKRASYNNQARIHNGYHYPRSFTTAYRSRVNLPKFVRDYPQAVRRDFAKLYAISRRNSKVTANQFVRFCQEAGAKIKTADSSSRGLFEPRLIEEVFLVEEYAFDSTKLASFADREMKRCGIEVLLQTKVHEISRGPGGNILVNLQTGQGKSEIIGGKYVFNCTYSGVNQIRGSFPSIQTDLKHEIAEMVLLKVPSALENFGITVMDGPFFSLMPFPAQELHTLSHVRFTPHVNWKDDVSVNPYSKLDQYQKVTRCDRMLRDAARYLPELGNAMYVSSLFEVKTVLGKNEGDDGRPILFEKHSELAGCFSILGGKIDNIYDIFEKLDGEEFVTHQGKHR